MTMEADVSIYTLDDLAQIIMRQQRTMDSLLSVMQVVAATLSGGVAVTNLVDLPQPVLAAPQALEATRDDAAIEALLNQQRAQFQTLAEQFQAALTGNQDAIKRLIPQSIRVGGGAQGRSVLTDAQGNPYSTSNPVPISQQSQSSEEKRLDYGTRTDTNPIHVGSAGAGTAEGSASWTVLDLSYDTSNRLTTVAVRTAIAWTAR